MYVSKNFILYFFLLDIRYLISKTLIEYLISYPKRIYYLLNFGYQINFQPIWSEYPTKLLSLRVMRIEDVKYLIRQKHGRQSVNRDTSPDLPKSGTKYEINVM